MLHHRDLKEKFRGRKGFDLTKNSFAAFAAKKISVTTPFTSGSAVVKNINLPFQKPENAEYS